MNPMNKQHKGFSSSKQSSYQRPSVPTYRTEALWSPPPASLWRNCTHHQAGFRKGQAAQGLWESPAPSKATLRTQTHLCCTCICLFQRHWKFADAENSRCVFHKRGETNSNSEVDTPLVQTLCVLNIVFFFFFLQTQSQLQKWKSQTSCHLREHKLWISGKPVLWNRPRLMQNISSAC